MSKITYSIINDKNNSYRLPLCETADSCFPAGMLLKSRLSVRKAPEKSHTPTEPPAPTKESAAPCLLIPWLHRTSTGWRAQGHHRAAHLANYTLFCHNPTSDDWTITYLKSKSRSTPTKPSGCPMISSPGWKFWRKKMTSPSISWSSSAAGMRWKI